MTTKTWIFAALAFILLLIVPLVSANANIFSDIKTAITGHIDDLEDRINHEDTILEGNTLVSGEFRADDPGVDRFHWAAGTASIVTNASGMYLQLGDDFDTGHAPDLYIYVADSKVVDESSFWSASGRVELAKLESGSGAQVYDLSGISDFSEVIIWCKAFGEFMGSATLS